jgi:two-component system response regulator YesN
MSEGIRPLKLLIVEDEDNTRNLLAAIADWASLGVSLVGEASTGLEALDLVEELLPDIVLTDIEMPFMDGLELSRRILGRYGDMSVIILTAHDHFEYAQKAIHTGVSDYILKPLDKRELERTVRAEAEKIRGRRELLGRMETSYKYMRENNRFLRDNLLRELVQGNKGSPSGLFEMAGLRGLEEEGSCALALVRLQGGGRADDVTENCRAYLARNYERGGELYVFADGSGNLALISRDRRVDLADVCRRAAHAIGGEGLRLFFGMSDPGFAAKDMPRAYAQAKDALRLAMAAAEPEAGSLPDKSERIPDLMLFVKSGLGAQALALAPAILAGAGDLNAAKVFAVDFLSGATQALAETGIPWLTLMQRIPPSYPRMLEQQGIKELEAVFLEQISGCCALAESHRQNQSREIVSKTIATLEEEYGNPNVSLTYVAQRHAINSSYLSRAFKAHTGKSFSEYLLETRIRKACDFLEKSDCKAYSLAALVGIPDPNYFAKCFKRVTGMSFQAYKAERPAVRNALP